ncbi:acylphosphatase [Vibrio profundi]|uniref:acylphosphatase n=1 Tax=Vibrio profundi TaxID=1774960 RepID=UPI003736CD59
MKHKCKLYIVSGIVQGVGFRYFTREQAVKLGITGYAKNLSNGDVEVLANGEEEKVILLGKWLETGPKTALVENVRELGDSLESTTSEFEIL